MSDEIEYIEPTQEHVGQMVEVRDHSSSPWMSMRFAGLIEHNFRFITENCEDKPSCYRFARIPRPKPEPTQEPPTKPIDWTKPVRTKDGRAVRVLCTGGPGKYPVIGLVDGHAFPKTWTMNGRQNLGAETDLDLENAPQRIQREYWVNVYASCLGSSHDTKEDADYHATGGRLACVKITIDCEEGEGL